MTHRILDTSSLEFTYASDKKRFDFLTREGNLFRWFTTTQLRTIFKVRHAIDGIMLELEAQGKKVGLRLERKGIDEDASYRFVDTLSAHIPEDVIKQIHAITSSATEKLKLETLEKVLDILMRAHIIPAGAVNVQKRTIGEEVYEDAVFINGIQSLISTAIAGLLIPIEVETSQEEEEGVVDEADGEAEETGDETGGEEGLGDAEDAGVDIQELADAGETQALKVLRGADFKALKHFDIYSHLLLNDGVKLTDLAQRFDLGDATLRVYIVEINKVLKTHKFSFLITIRDRNKDGVFVVYKKDLKDKKKKTGKVQGDEGVVGSEGEADADIVDEKDHTIEIKELSKEDLETLKKTNDDVLIDEEKSTINNVRLSQTEFLFFVFMLSQRGKKLNIKEVFSLLEVDIKKTKDEAKMRGEVGMIVRRIKEKLGKRNEYIHIKTVEGHIMICPLVASEETIKIGKESIIYSLEKFYVKLKGKIVSLTTANKEFLLDVFQNKKFSKSYTRDDDKNIEFLNSYFVREGISLKLEIESHRVTLVGRKETKYDVSKLLSKKGDLAAALSQATIAPMSVDPSTNTLYLDAGKTQKVIFTEPEFIIYLAFLAFLGTRCSVSDIYTILGFDELDSDFQEYFLELREFINMKLATKYTIRDTDENDTKYYYIDFNETDEEEEEKIEYQAREDLKIVVNLTKRTISFNGKQKSGISKDVFAYIARFCRNKKDELKLDFKGHPDAIVNRITIEFRTLELPFKIRADKVQGKVIISLKEV